ncbi:endolytic transglycosylase MltG [Pseudodesulfovibrio sp. F-1]|uniref:Endolytic murein transglycosylase n=1 Tax=Pseudodesulfovibrio alkaliphilus TaxID=2661613 RepID=A0A7K1KJV6_9BACT|nr:endolytic transglycosylase MltG [Pseudodesulfovibrio alkaliphilus]MUM76325.1 endolytic transglycosylase MltG [Pseudodesulfovibrio alkaliphilus]
MARKRTILLTLGGLTLLAILALGGYKGHQLWLDHRFHTVPPESPGREMVFRVEPGQPFSVIAAGLRSDGLISDGRRFRAMAVRENKTASIRAGEFLLHTGWTPDRILHELTTSAGIMRRVAVREGLTWWQTAQVVEEAGVGSHAAFAEAVSDPDLLAGFGILADSAEGYLFPETYLITPPRGDHSRAMVELMVREFFANAAKVWPDGLPDWDDLHRTVIIASLVEKETGVPEERARIAGVFHSRLKKRMLIQADPTIIYGLGEAFDGNISRVHLRDPDNPYNTYVHRGLPPGPICSPGLEALLATVNPEEHEYLYFVARGDGSHQFSKTLEEHNRAVVRYQIRRNPATYRSTPAPGGQVQ